MSLLAKLHDEDAGGTPVVVVAGEIDSSNAAEIGDRLRATISNQSMAMVVEAASGVPERVGDVLVEAERGLEAMRVGGAADERAHVVHQRRRDEDFEVPRVEADEPAELPRAGGHTAAVGGHGRAAEIQGFEQRVQRTDGRCAHCRPLSAVEPEASPIFRRFSGRWCGRSFLAVVSSKACTSGAGGGKAGGPAGDGVLKLEVLTT